MKRKLIRTLEAGFPRIEKHYFLNDWTDMVKVLPPTVPSESLLDAIKKAYEECGKVTYNAKNIEGGNETFYFVKR